MDDDKKLLAKTMTVHGVEIGRAFSEEVSTQIMDVPDNATAIFYFVAGGAIAKTLATLGEQLGFPGAANSFLAGFTSFQEYAAQEDGGAGNSHNTFDKVFSSN